MAYIRGMLFLVTAWLNIATISRCVVQCQIILIIIILVAKCKNSCNKNPIIIGHANNYATVAVEALRKISITCM